MIMAAGLGTRLRPLTENKPKALLEYHGFPLIYYVLRSLANHGFTKVVVNVHHLAYQVVDYLKRCEFPTLDIQISDESELLLDTGGGLKKAESVFDEGPILVHNVDILTGLNLNELWAHHIQNKYIATLAVKYRETSRYLLMNEERLLCGWKHRDTGETILSRKNGRMEEIAFSAIYIVEKQFIKLLPGQQVFPIMPEILKIATGHKIGLFLHTDDWKDMGKIESFS